MTIRNIIIAASLVVVTMASCQDSLEERCAKEAADFTKKKCPARIDDFVMIDSMTFDKNTKTIGYWYHVTEKADNPQLFDKKSMRKELADRMRNTTTLQLYKDAGYNFRFIYRSADGKTCYLDETIVQKDYK